jgi:hypothetical protein
VDTAEKAGFQGLAVEVRCWCPFQDTIQPLDITKYELESVVNNSVLLWLCEQGGGEYTRNRIQASDDGPVVLGPTAEKVVEALHHLRDVLG